MDLQISTPPNAIAYRSGKIAAKDFIILGLVIGAIASLIVVWLKLVA